MSSHNNMALVLVWPNYSITFSLYTTSICCCHCK